MSLEISKDVYFDCDRVQLKYKEPNWDYNTMPMDDSAYKDPEYNKFEYYRREHGRTNTYKIIKFKGNSLWIKMECISRVKKKK